MIPKGPTTKSVERNAEAMYRLIVKVARALEGTDYGYLAASAQNLIEKIEGANDEHER